MSKTIISDLGYCEARVGHNNRTTVTIFGQNTNGGPECVTLENLDTFYLSHIADEIAQALVKVRNKVNKDIEMVRQSLD